MAENNTDSSVLYFTRLNGIIFSGPILFLVICLAVYFYVPVLNEICLVFSIVAMIWIAMTWVTFHFSSLTIKKKGVILRTGMLVRKTVDIPLSKIETIDITQSIVGSLLRYGTLVITGTGGTKHFINYLSHPLTCRRYIEQLMNAP